MKMVKLRIKIFFIVLITVLLFFSAVYIFLVFKGKDIIIRQLENFTKKKVTIDYFDITPPLNLDLRNLDIRGVAKIDSIFISPSMVRLLMGRIAFNEIRITRPSFTYEKFLPQAAETQAAVAPAAATATTDLAAAAIPAATKVVSAPKKKHRPDLVFKRITVNDGRLDFIDHTAGEKGIKIAVKDIFFNLTNFHTLPHAVVTGFELKGRIPWMEGKEEGKIEAEGWLNLVKRDMDASLKIADIDGIALYPYYSAWVDLQKARIEKAKLNFTSNIHGFNNNLTAECHLELTDIVFKQRSPEEQQEKAEKIATTVLDIFKALNQGKIVLDFTIRTKMDRPEFGFGSIKMALEDKLATGTKGSKLDVNNILMFPAVLWEKGVKGATHISQAVIEGTISLGKDLKETIEGVIKKEKKE